MRDTSCCVRREQSRPLEPELLTFQKPSSGIIAQVSRCTRTPEDPAKKGTKVRGNRYRGARGGAPGVTS